MKIAIQGHLTRGKEVIQILENLGGINDSLFTGIRKDCWYFIDSNWHISNEYQTVLIHAGFKTYTLEEFEKEFPFKVGDRVESLTTGLIGTITNLFGNGIYYFKYDNEICSLAAAKYLKLYKEMKEERNIKLTLEKAKEWYKKGGELKEVALQAYSEEELNSLPKSWEEFCKQGNPIASWRYDIPIKYQTLFKLEQLRDCWRQGNIPQKDKYKIRKVRNKYTIVHGMEDAFLSFCDLQTTEEFLKCFRDLIEKAGDLI